MALDHVVGIVVGVVCVGVHLEVLKPVPVNSVWSKTFIWTPISTFYDAQELSYTLKWTQTMLLALFFFGVGVHLQVPKPVPINSAWPKTYIWTPRSTFYDARELS